MSIEDLISDSMTRLEEDCLYGACSQMCTHGCRACPIGKKRIELKELAQKAAWHAYPEDEGMLEDGKAYLVYCEWETGGTNVYVQYWYDAEKWPFRYRAFMEIPDAPEFLTGNVHPVDK